VNAVMNLQIPLNTGQFLSSCTTSDFSRRTQLHEVSYCSVKIFFYSEDDERRFLKNVVINLRRCTVLRVQ
jgi:hypothetical protein